MHSWIFRNRARLALIYGLVPPALPAHPYRVERRGPGNVLLVPAGGSAAVDERPSRTRRPPPGV